MIQVSFLTVPSGELLGFSISGHSGAGTAGNDIVCAAVSSAAYLVVNTVTEILRAEAEVSVSDDGKMRICVASKDAPICRSLFAGFKLHMLGLEEQYPTNIHVSYAEV